MTQPNHCARCGKWAGAHATLPGQSTGHLCMCVPAPVEKAAPSALDPNETDPTVLWAEIARLQAAVAGPDGYASWQEAATAERLRRVRAEKALTAQQAAQPVADHFADVNKLVAELADMEARKDAAYLERNQVVAALAKAHPSGVARTAIEGWSEDWHGCVYIDLPTGQASWHFHDSQAYLFADLPPYAGKWDGHDTPEKYRRLAALKVAAQPVAGEPVMVEAVAEVVDTDDGLTLRWLIEGGIAAMSDGAVLVMPHSPITGNDGSGEVYTAAPAAVGLVPLTSAKDRLGATYVEGYGYVDTAAVRAIERARGIKAGKDVAHG